MIEGKTKSFKPAPAHYLAIAVAIALAMTAFAILTAVRQPWLGLQLSYDAAAQGAIVRDARGPAAAVPVGTVLQNVGTGPRTMRLMPEDFTIEPAGGIATFRLFADFLTRQQSLSEIVATPEVFVEDSKQQRWTLRPAPRRPLSDLPVEFWVQVFVGAFAWLISAAIWSFRSSETSARYLLLSGWATLMFAPLAAIYSTRELALPASLFRTINDLNFLGGSLFAAALAALLLYYPRRIAPAWVGLTIVGIFIAWFIAQEIGLFESMAIARRLLVMIAVLGTFVLAAVQWRFTRSDPIARAALQWFLLSWLVGVSIFAGCILLPQMFGIDTSHLQGYGFLLFLLVYGGLAFGIMRFRLFDLGEWWVRVLVWMASLLMLVALDLLFLLGLQLSSEMSLALALLICGVLWLPLRGWLWHRFFPPEALNERAYFQNIVSIALAPRAAQPAQWTDLLRKIFDPLRIDTIDDVAEARFEQDGLMLVVPCAVTVPALRLSYAHGGRKLFTRQDLHLVTELLGMLKYTVESRAAFESGAALERSRIAADIHDNVGARLLSALHSPGDERKDGLIRATIADLRSIIADASGPGTSLAEALAGLRRETADRLQAHAIDLQWPVDEIDEIEPAGTIVHTLRSIVRECVSNTIKHANATSVRILIEVTQDRIHMKLQDNGIGFDPERADPGNGLAILRRRIAALHGELAWFEPDEGGYGLAVALPFTVAERRE